jgi:hypothetical protein
MRAEIDAIGGRLAIGRSRMNRSLSALTTSGLARVGTVAASLAGRTRCSFHGHQAPAWSARASAHSPWLPTGAAGLAAAVTASGCEPIACGRRSAEHRQVESSGDLEQISERLNFGFSPTWPGQVGLAPSCRCCDRGIVSP